MLNSPEFIKEKLSKLFSNAHCELEYRNIYELSIAVILSAQTSDKQVNKVTKELFNKYDDIYKLSNASKEDVEKYIKAIGLAKRKSEYLINCAKYVVEKYNGIFPNTIDELIKIPGIGRKTANVIISEGYQLPGFAVDVHVERVSKRLGLVSLNDDVIIVENKLKNLYSPTEWHKMHHYMIFMGRYLCKSSNPMCNKCPFSLNCNYQNNDKKTSIHKV